MTPRVSGCSLGSTFSPSSFLQSPSRRDRAVLAGCASSHHVELASISHSNILGAKPGQKLA